MTTVQEDNDRIKRVEALFGSLHKYANPALREKEDKAWQMAVDEQYLYLNKYNHDRQRKT